MPETLTPDTRRALTGVIANPDLGFHPATTQNAWIMLKEARGQTVDLDRIGDPRHMIEREGTMSLTARILARASAIGRTRPDPLILRPGTGGDAA